MFCLGILFCFFPFEWLLVGFVSGCSPRANNIFLHLMGRAGFAHWWRWRNPVDFNVSSCCGLVFFTVIILFMGRKKPAFPPTLKITQFIPLNHFPGVSNENKPSLCVLVLLCQLCFVSFPVIRAEAIFQLWWHA